MNELSFIRILKYPFPKTKTFKDIFLQSVFIALAVYFFLVLFQPFGTYTFKHSLKYLILIPYSIIAFTIFSLTKYLINKLNFVKWNINNEIISTISILCLCSVLNYFYSIRIINYTNFRLYNLIFMFFCTFSIGIPICLIYFFATFAISIKNKNHLISENSTTNTEGLVENNKLFQINDLQIDDITQNFIFAKSEGNYSYIFYYHHLKVEKKLIRITFSNLEKKILSENIIRCHRSYIINKNYIVSKKGNAQGYKLSIKDISEQIPVSRKYLNAII